MFTNTMNLDAHRSTPLASTGARRALLCVFFLGAASLCTSCSHEAPAASAAHESENAAGESAAPETPSEVRLTAESIAINGIRVEKVAKHELQSMFRVPGHVAFNKESMAHVGSPVKGRVAELGAKPGEEVRKGAVLLVIESPELGEAQSEYLQKRSAAQTVVPAVELAKSAYERGKGLYEQTQGIPLSEVQKRESELRAAQAALQAAKTAEQAAENKLHLLGMSQEIVQRLGASGEIDPRFTVRAPIDGQVIEREVTLGELVGPEREALLVLADVSKLWVLADVPEAKLREVSVGAHARVLLGAEQEHWCEGVVAFVSAALDPATRSVRVRIDVADRHPELRPGVFAQVEIVSTVVDGRAATSVVAVREGAIQRIDGETVVFVPLPGTEGAFAKRVVHVGAAVGGLVPVLSGLREGEECVSAGSFILKADLTKGSAAHDD
jgi:membrane fusion protein, heavy metal efflux system